MNEKTYIKAEHATYQYEKSIFAIKPLDLELQQNQIIFVIGDNGSGKSTLGKLLAGIYKPKEGLVILENKDTRELSLGEIGQKVGYLWQKPEMQLFAPTVLEELTFIDILNKKDKRKSERDALEWLGAFDMGHLKGASTHTLSRGEKQRLALAAVISRGAQYLILDEPTKGLDKRRKLGLENLLLQLNQKQGIGMTIISHDKSFTHSLATRVITMNEGGIIHDQAL